MTEQLTKRLEHQEIYLEISDEANVWIAEQAYDPIYGARPIKRFLTREVETPLAKEIVAGNVPPKTKVVIKLVDDELTFEKITLEE
jgi:ATP-dependent Clp protease ATP-binding subunit ClpB